MALLPRVQAVACLALLLAVAASAKRSLNEDWDWDDERFEEMDATLAASGQRSLTDLGVPADPGTYTGDTMPSDPGELDPNGTRELNPGGTGGVDTQNWLGGDENNDEGVEKATDALEAGRIEPVQYGSVWVDAWSKDEKKATKKVSKVMAKPGPQGGLAAYSLGTQAAKGKLTDKAYGKVFATACAQPGKAPKNAAKSYGSVIVRGGKEAKACAVALAQSVTFTVVVKVEVVVLAVAECFQYAIEQLTCKDVWEFIELVLKTAKSKKEFKALVKVFKGLPIVEKCLKEASQCCPAKYPTITTVVQTTTTVTTTQQITGGK